jgi:hypothetical protein
MSEFTRLYNGHAEDRDLAEATVRESFHAQVDQLNGQAYFKEAEILKAKREFVNGDASALSRLTQFQDEVFAIYDAVHSACQLRSSILDEEPCAGDCEDCDVLETMDCDDCDDEDCNIHKDN